MVTGHWYTQVPNFGSLSWFWRCKEHPCPLSPYLGLWWGLEVPNWGLASWSWFVYGHWSLTHSSFKFEFWRYKEHPCPLSPYLGLWRTLEVSDWWLVSWSWFRYGHWDLIYPCSKFLFPILIWRGKEHSCPISPDFGLWWRLEVPDWGFSPCSWIVYGHWSLIHPYSKFWLSVFILKGQ